MAFDREKEPGDELEDYGDELSSDYREEEEATGEEGEELEEEISYKREKGAVEEKLPPAPPSLHLQEVME